MCHEQYVGQTSNKLSKRWSVLCSNWNKQDCKTHSDKDQMALSQHYSENHGTINKPPLHEAYTVTFVELPSCHSLDISVRHGYAGDAIAFPRLKILAIIRANFLKIWAKYTATFTCKWGSVYFPNQSKIITRSTEK